MYHYMYMYTYTTYCSLQACIIPTNKFIFEEGRKKTLTVECYNMGVVSYFVMLSTKDAYHISKSKHEFHAFVCAFPQQQMELYSHLTLPCALWVSKQPKLLTYKFYNTFANSSSMASCFVIKECRTLLTTFMLDRT